MSLFKGFLKSTFFKVIITKQDVFYNYFQCHDHYFSFLFNFNFCILESKYNSIKCFYFICLSRCNCSIFTNQRHEHICIPRDRLSYSTRIRISPWIEKVFGQRGNPRNWKGKCGWN